MMKASSKKSRKKARTKTSDVDENQEADLAAGQGGQQMLDPEVAVHAVESQREHARADQDEDDEGGELRGRSVACRIRSQLSRRLAAPRMSAPAAPIAPPSVGVAMPRKIVPSTRKIRNSGGTMTNVVCCGHRGQEAESRKLIDHPVQDGHEECEQDAVEHAQHDEIGAMRLVNSRIMNQPNTTLASESTPSDSSPRLPSCSRKPMRLRRQTRRRLREDHRDAERHSRHRGRRAQCPG